VGFPPDDKLTIVAALVRSASAHGDGVPRWTKVLRDLAAGGEFGSLPTRPTLRKWWGQHLLSRQDPNRVRARAAVERQQQRGEVIELPGSRPPPDEPAGELSTTPDLRRMTRAAFHAYMAQASMEVAELARSTALTLSSYPAAAKTAEHHFELMLSHAAGDGPEDLTPEAFVAALGSQWSHAPDSALEVVLRVYGERHGVAILALHGDGTSTTRLDPDGWVEGPTVAGEATG